MSGFPAWDSGAIAPTVTPTQWASFRSKLNKAVLKSSLSPNKKREHLKTALLEAIPEDFSKAVPHELLSSTLSGLILDSQYECSLLRQDKAQMTQGASSQCGSLFELETHEIDSFLKSIKAGVEVDPFFSGQSKSELRRMLINSLDKNEGWKKMQPEERLATLQVLDDSQIPRYGRAPDSIRTVPNLTSTEKTVILEWTKSNFKVLRAEQQRTPEQRRERSKEPENDALDKEARKDIAIIQGLFKKVPRYQGVVYRGIAVSDPAILFTLLDQFSENSVVNLGFNNTPALSSATLSYHVAYRFSRPKKAGVFVSIIYRIQQFSGIDISGASCNGYEEEVILPDSSRYQVTGVHRIKSDSSGRSFLIDLFERREKWSSNQ